MYKCQQSSDMPHASKFRTQKSKFNIEK